ncbi:MAG: hypothetical protein WD886_04515 [Burkholderiales bacterium]
MGQALGGPWTFVGPAAGFGVGLVADMKMMKRFHRKAQADAETPDGRGSAAAFGDSSPSCGIASGLTRMLSAKGARERREMTLAEIRETYRTEPGEPPVRG